MVQTCKYSPKSPKLAAKISAPIDDLLDPEFFKALGDPTRLRLLACLAKCGRACSVSEIGECCSVDLSVVSRHLAVLARAGVIDASKKGREVFYKVHFKEIGKILRNLAKELENCCPSKKTENSNECC